MHLSDTERINRETKDLAGETVGTRAIKLPGKAKAKTKGVVPASPLEGFKEQLVGTPRGDPSVSITISRNVLMLLQELLARRAVMCALKPTALNRTSSV